MLCLLAPARYCKRNGKGPVTRTIPVLIVDYGMGNLRSVVNAFAAIGCEAVVSNDPADTSGAQRIVLPGVGAFGDAMNNLRATGWLDALEENVRSKGKPFLGLCLGMQLLATIGTEHGTHAGLGWVSGAVERITNDDSSVRIPHIGWNDVEFTQINGLYSGLGKAQTFYFVHSYVLKPVESTVISGICNYGSSFAASIEIDNIFATQFHPEKSQKAGLAVLKNFISAAG